MYHKYLKKNNLNYEYSIYTTLVNAGAQTFNPDMAMN